MQIVTSTCKCNSQCWLEGKLRWQRGVLPPTKVRGAQRSGYTPLTQEERYQIYFLKKPGHHQAEIAETLERHNSTVSHVRKRNQGLKGYRPQQAHGLALVRRDEVERLIPRGLESGADRGPTGEGA